MMRYCPNCGTEVDETALFCPTCGQAIDQAAETEIPPAPSWPEPDPVQPAAPPPPAWDAPAEPETATWDAPAEPAPSGWDTPVEPPAGVAPASAPIAEEAPPVPTPHAPQREPARPARAATPPILTLPVTLSGWLIGGGAVIGALGALISLFGGIVLPVELLLLVALAGVAATVFLAPALPAIGNLRLVTLAVVLVAFGVALDRISIGGAGIGTLLLFLGTAAAGIGAIILELGRDQPLGAA
jgi:hypothetical protein